MSSTPITPKGTHDLLPSDLIAWQQLEAVARKVLRQFNYQEIRTPVIEHLELFERGVGESTDIVNKEMYAFTKSDRQLCLRPEATASVARAFINHGMGRWPKPVKLFYMGPMFRYERPQAGRQRQFHQLGIEQFGLDTPEADFDAIMLAMSLLDELGLKGLKLHINAIGDSNTREVLTHALRDLLQPERPNLCQDCQRRFEQNPLRMLDCKVPSCQAIYSQKQAAQLLADVVDEADPTGHFKRLCQLLTQFGVAFERNPLLVRGLDYYTKTVFEITADNLGAQNAVCGGGRYNGLVKQLGGPDTPAVGWAMGLERLISLLPRPEGSGIDAVVVGDDFAANYQKALQLRKAGKAVEVDLSGKNPNKQWDWAGKQNATEVIKL